MNKVKIALVFTFLTYFIAQAVAQPTLDWVKVFSNQTVLGNYAISRQATDAAGNLYQTGYFSQNTDFDPGPDEYILHAASGKPQPFILKLDPLGQFVWAKAIQMDHEIYGTYGPVPVTIDNEGNVLITGAFYGNADFDPGPDVFTVKSSGSRTDLFFLKLDSEGNFVWAQTIGSKLFKPLSNLPTDIAHDDNGAMLVSGVFTDTVDFDPGPGVHAVKTTASFLNNIFVLKLDKAGQFSWVKTIGGAQSQVFVSGFKRSQTGKLFLLGTFTDVTDFDPGAGVVNLTSPNGHYSTFICQLGQDGSFGWAKSVPGEAGQVFGDVLAVDDQENVFLSGTFEKSADFDPGPGVMQLNAAPYGLGQYLLKLKPNGDFSWAKMQGCYLPGTRTTLRVLPSGRLLLGGSFQGTIDFDPGPDSLIVKSVGYHIPTPAYPNTDDGFLCTFNPDGALQSLYLMRGSKNDQVHSVTVQSDSALYVSGFYSDTADLDPSANVMNLPGKDFFIARWSMPLLNLTPNPGIPGLSVYPNPVRDFIALDFDSTPGDVHITIYDAAGRRLQNETLTSASTYLTIPFKLEANGVYWLQVQLSDGQKAVYKMIKQ